MKRRITNAPIEIEKNVANSAEPIAPNGDRTVIEALDTVQSLAEDSELDEDFWAACSEELEFLSNVLELNKNQVILVAILSEMGEAAPWKKIGEFLGLSRLKTMAFTPDIDDLKKKRWVYETGAHDMNGVWQGYKLAFGVINALRHNEKFVPEKIDGLTEQQFIDKLVRYMRNADRDRFLSNKDKHEFMLHLCEVNSHLPLCAMIEKLQTEESKILALITANDYAISRDDENEGASIFNLDDWFDDDFTLDCFSDNIQNGDQELFKMGVLEHCCSDGLVDTSRFKFTDKAKADYLGQYKRRKGPARMPMYDNDILLSKDIKEKPLYYNEAEKCQINRLRGVFSEEGLESVQKRLAESGLRSGITCLFYGSPGTGKTESVMQLARECGRDVFQVDIAGLRDKYVGESEKNIKNIFARYRELCNSCKKTPILLFNEADAIINNRFEAVTSSVEKMDNAIQNIILQEMETLSGIMIATTNLTGTLDKAFDRRFLFKVEFNKPNQEAKASIWRSMLPELSENDSQALASEYDFSGGQIENIVRKVKIDYVISGEALTLSKMRAFCNEEFLNRSNRARIGF